MHAAFIRNTYIANIHKFHLRFGFLVAQLNLNIKPQPSSRYMYLCVKQGTYSKTKFSSNGQKIISCYPQYSGSKFLCDSRGGLRFAVRRHLAGLLDLNVRHTIVKKSFLNTEGTFFR